MREVLQYVTSVPFIPLCLFLCVSSDSLSAPLNVTIKALEGNSAIVTWEILEGDPVIGFAITQQVLNQLMVHFKSLHVQNRGKSPHNSSLMRQYHGGILV